MKEFVAFLLTKVFDSQPVPEALIENAWQKTLADIRYHFPELSSEKIADRIKSNSSELAVFLFRLGSELHTAGLEALKPQVHGLLRELCGCEIYFNNIIGEGFYVVHGLGTVIGSRNTIGKGFVIHQGCTIGHKKNGEGAGNTIGDNVKLYANSSIIGALYIGDNVVIGGHVMVHTSVEANRIVTQKTPLAVRGL